MSKRLQVLLAEWVRQAFGVARREPSRKDPSMKLASIRVAAKFGFPTSDIHTMLAEIERGYGIDPEK